MHDQIMHLQDYGAPQMFTATLMHNPSKFRRLFMGTSLEFSVGMLPAYIHDVVNNIQGGGRIFHEGRPEMYAARGVQA